MGKLGQTLTWVSGIAGSTETAYWRDWQKANEDSFIGVGLIHAKTRIVTAPLSSFRPSRSLAHPLWLGALLVLLVNDHLLKGSALPGWLTGKLSDFAGPIVAAALLAVLLRVRSKRGWVLSHVATAVGFAAINVVPSVAHWVQDVSASTPFPWIITVDPSDIVGLVALPLSFLVLGNASTGDTTHSIPWRRWTRRVSVPVAAVACMATSAPQEPNEEWPENFPNQPGAVSISNDTDDARLIRVRTLKETVQIDCEAVLNEPSQALSRDLFGAADTWLLEARRALPLQGLGGDCSVYLIETEEMPATLLVWDRFEFPDGSVPTSSDVQDARMARLTYLGDTWINLVHETAAYLRTPTPAPEACQIASATTGVDWSAALSGPREIAEIATSPNGCHEVTFTSGPDLVLCIPADLPFASGESIQVATATAFDGERTSDSISLTSDAVALNVMRGSVLPEGTVGMQALESCPMQHDECGNSAQAARIEIGDSGEDFGSAGDTLSLANGSELHLVRVQQMPARDLECAPAADGLDYIEFFTIQNISDLP